ncbi:hypothetical protein Tco_0978156 [Tanacetum coccineum]|uniref:Uncharacterized protein n=1 Tax=Tanacetum coccineum TaxID=301880 RepID=A0ABQ5EMA1_9ASTR
MPPHLHRKFRMRVAIATGCRGYYKPGTRAWQLLLDLMEDGECTWTIVVCSENQKVKYAASSVGGGILFQVIEMERLKNGILEITDSRSYHAAYTDRFHELDKMGLTHLVEPEVQHVIKRAGILTGEAIACGNLVM